MRWLGSLQVLVNRKPQLSAEYKAPWSPCLHRAEPLRTLDNSTLAAGATVTVTVPLATTTSRNFVRVIQDCEWRALYVFIPGARGCARG